MSKFHVLGHYEQVATDAMAKKMEELELESLSAKAAEVDTTLEHLELEIADEGTGGEGVHEVRYLIVGIALAGKPGSAPVRAGVA